MSSKPNKQETAGAERASKTEKDAPFQRTYTVTAKGPINFGGVLKRQGDPVILSDAQAAHYKGLIKPAGKLKPVDDASKPKSQTKDAGRQEDGQD